MRCIHCGQELPNGSKYCFRCGKSQLIESDNVLPVKYCPFCGSENDSDSVFCCECGERIDGSGKRTKVKKHGSVRRVIAVILIFALICSAGYLGYRYKLWDRLKFADDNSKQNYSLMGSYIKDGQIYTVTPGGKEVKPELLEGDFYSWDNMIDYNSTLVIPRLSEDKKHFYYCSEYDTYSDKHTASLYTKKAGSVSSPVKLADSVESYAVLNNNKVIYENASEKLYLVDLKGEKTRIAGSVEWYSIDPEKKHIVWRTTDTDSDGGYSAYYQAVDLKKDPIKIGDHIQVDFPGNNADMMSVHDLRTDEWSVIIDFGEPISLNNEDNNISLVEAIDKEQKCIYYTRKKMIRAESYWNQFIQDDCSKTDAKANSVREYLTSRFNSGDGNYITYDLCAWHDGEEVILCTDYIFNDTALYQNGQGPISSITYQYYLFQGRDYTAIEKTPLSTLLERTEAEISDTVDGAMDDSIRTIRYDSSDGVQVSEALVQDYEALTIGNAVGNTLYIAGKTSRNETESKLMKYDTGNLGSGGQVISNNPYSIAIEMSGHVYYTADYDKDHKAAELYRDDKLISDAVYTSFFPAGFNVLRKPKDVLYASNYYEDSHLFDLNIYDGKKSKLIAEDVVSVSKVGEDSLLVLMNYYYGSGDVALYKDGSLTLLDSNVSFLLGTSVNYDYMLGKE